MTRRQPGAIDHPFHIHLKVFDPNEGLVDPEPGRLLTQLEVMNQNHKPVLDGNGNPQIKPRTSLTSLATALIAQRLLRAGDGARPAVDAAQIDR
jgi:hypothetical protein